MPHPFQRVLPLLLPLLLLFVAVDSGAASGATAAAPANAFPPPLESYGDREVVRLGEILAGRVRKEPFNLLATVLFALAVLHTFLTFKFRHWAHELEHRHRKEWQRECEEARARGEEPPPETTLARARLLHFLGEVEAVFGIWVIPLMLAMAWRFGPGTAVHYLEHRVSFTEPIFVVVIMAMAATRPVLRLADNLLGLAAGALGGGPRAWWFVILTLGPLLGSFITEPAAMTISALLLVRKFYAFAPSARMAYATLGLLFVNVSVGGTLTHFAAPPVLMVAAPWKWDTAFMFTHFGWRAALGIVLATGLYLVLFRAGFAQVAENARHAGQADPDVRRERPIPAWITAVHIAFLGWSVLHSHHPVLLVGGFLFFLAFMQVSPDFQQPLDLRGPVLVGFFLAGLVVHGGLQQWWIGPVLGRLGEGPLFLAATVLTAFNDNAAITYLATLVPGLSDGLKIAVVAGAVTGGGLTVIANAPNPAGQAILQKFFPGGVSPLGLALGALVPTVIVGAALMVLRG
ncbi:MAG: putative Na+/H+ antiporter [Limisphaerales bacterium]